MKRWFLTLIVSLLLFPLLGQAKVYKVEDVPMVHLQDSTKYVCNPDMILTQPTVTAIDTMLFALEHTTGIEVVVLALSDIEDGDCYQFALDMGSKYGVGKKKQDNGLIVLLCTEQRCVQFLTGYGLEGILPDAICKRIQETYMNPHFAEGDWDKGMLEGMKAVHGYLNGSMEIEKEQQKKGSGNALGVLVGCVVFFGVLIWFLGRGKRCPQCKKRGFKRVSSELVSEEGDRKHYKATYKCSKCGYTEERDEESTNSSNGAAGGAAIGGLGGIVGSKGSSRRTPSSPGGHFGGGSFGGGGAGSKF